MSAIHQKQSLSFIENIYDGAKIGGVLGFSLGVTLASETFLFRGLNLVMEVGIRTLGKNPTYPLYQEECALEPFHHFPTCANPHTAPLPFTATVITACTITGTVFGVVSALAGSLYEYEPIPLL